MALVKTTKFDARPAPALRPVEAIPAAPPRASVAHRRAQDRSRARREKAAERIGAATEELAAGVTEAAAAAEELRRSLEQIAAAAEQAAGAAHQSQAAIDAMGAVFVSASGRAEQARGRTGAVRALMAEIGTELTQAAQAVRENAERLLRTVEVTASLEESAGHIGGITATVADIADQTNLLALNAAIEAARAGGTRDGLRGGGR